MERGRITECFLRLHQCVDDAAYICQTGTGVPEAVQSGITELAREVKNTRMAVERDSESNEIAQCLRTLEVTGERTLSACRENDNVDRRLQNYVQEAHDVISDLKHRLLH